MPKPTPALPFSLVLPLLQALLDELAMRNFSLVSRSLRRAGKLHLTDLSPEAKRRLTWFDWHAAHGKNVSLTCRHFAISRSTFYTWAKRYDPKDLRSLEDRSSRPKRCREKGWTTAEVLAVLKLRRKHPYMGKMKLQVLLNRAGMTLSASKIGRILGYLKRSWRLIEPLRRLTGRRRGHPRPHAIRMPKGFVPRLPGDLIQLDTVDLRPVPGTVLKQFTAVDVVSRWSVAFLAHDATSASAKRALAAIRSRMPFPVRRVQVDGGSEFMGVFEEALRDLKVPLIVLPPHSPKLNGRVERANRTYREEFYDYSTAEPTVRGLAPELLRWEHWYNHSRPHQALAYATPARFLATHYPEVSTTS